MMNIYSKLFRTKEDQEKFDKVACGDYFIKFSHIKGVQFENILNQSMIDRLLQFRKGDYKLVDVKEIESEEDCQEFYATTSHVYDPKVEGPFTVISIEEIKDDDDDE